VRAAGLALAEHWKVYLPVMLGSFALMLPAVLGAGAAARARAWFVASIALVLAAQLLLPVLPAGVWPLALCLLLFFTPFNVLEAMLPSLVSRLAPPAAKGAAIGVYSSVQFFGTFLGAAGGGYLYGRWGLAGVVIANAVLLVFWLILALGTRLPARPSSRAYALPALDHGHADGLSARLRALPGVRAVRIDAGARVAHLTVDSAQFDEQNVIRLIAGET
jgi:MFS family permease